MKKLQHLVLLFAFALMSYSSGLHAEDTDIYVANAANLGTPNVLFVIDTGANFSSSAAVPCTAYASGGAPSLGGTAGGIEQCALVDAINGLNDSAVNIGILVNNNNNFATDTRLATDPAYHETCQGTYGGCVVRKLALMDTAGKASMVNFIKSWKTSGQDSATEFNVKSGGDRTANTMQEAWAYFNGKTGMSTKNYATSIVGSGCQKNFIIFIGNAFNNSGTPADSGTESPYNGTYGMTAAQTAATPDQLKKITDAVFFTPATCGATSSLASTSASNWSENWADEWARLMNQQSGGTAGTQNIITYTIGVVNDSACKPDYPALLSSMAANGGGQFYKAANSSDIKNALDTILNQVQAVNSVFSSASLPVSVNADGSYLNQIYLGMFRPDSLAAPRWLGNLKQYHLVKINGVLVQGDAQTPPAGAINPTTGFIKPDAVSFWTKKDTSALPDSTGGFWKNAKASQGTLKSPYDSPDGEVVEKGGVSQQLRLESLVADFTATAQTTTNPRRMYVYCPDGSATCSKDLTAASNKFAVSNTGIATDAFGSDTFVPVASIVRPDAAPTTAIVTTNGNHGLSTGTTVTISGATQPEYNVTQSVTVNSSNTFTITGLPDFPTTPTQGTYLIAPPGGTTSTITSMVRSTHTTGGNNTETVTVTTSAPHGFTTASNVTISGASPSTYNYSGAPASVPSSTTFTFNVAIAPATPAVNKYTAQLSPSVYSALAVTLSNPTSGEIDGSTSTAHNLRVGQTVTIVGASKSSKYKGTYTITSVPSSTTFKITSAGTISGASRETGTVSGSATAVTITSITRAASTDAATATATVSTAFGGVSGDTFVMNIAKSSGSATNESAYLASNVVATCTTSGCTTFTYPITVTPSSTITLSSATVGVQGASSYNVPAGNITRVGTTATVSNVPSGTFHSGDTLTITATGTPLSSEADYLGTWVIDCGAVTTCTSFTFGPVNRTPATPATGIDITAFAEGVAPDRDTLVRWIRGQDNFGGEKGPGGTVTVRPSIHGDVLHSRPLVINYGDSRGIVVFYGSNDGVYRAVNGNQITGNIGGVVPGGELWGLVMPEHFGQYNRQRLNTPQLKFPSTTLASARPKDYFSDGQTAAYQLTKADGTIDKAYIFVTMRRGGRFMYAIDVTQPLTPKILWKISNTDTGFSQLGQTWARPRTTLAQGGGLGTNPVLIFGAGYDPAEDSQPPATDTMGRGIFVLDAVTGAIIWRANPTCTTSSTCRNVPDMLYSVPSDIAFVDRDGDGYTDKLYFGDTGGNLWRADISDASTANWTVTKIGALGCTEGAPSTSTHLCADGTAPRKFFFPPAVLAVKAAGATGSFDAISIPSGDREHPLKETATASAYKANNKFFMINDLGTTVGGTPPTHDLTVANLFDATSAPYDSAASASKPNGFYITFSAGEKGVNAPLATNGLVFFATNQPKDPDATCSPNLGQAIAYAVSPFLGTITSNVIVGGGLPPSPVAGLINITDSVTGETTEERFCIGCAAACTTCSALENSPPPNVIPKNLKRTYWYKK